LNFPFISLPVFPSCCRVKSSLSSISPIQSRSSDYIQYMASANTTSRSPSGGIPPQHQTIQQRLQGVIQHQQFVWWVGHVIIVLSTFLHALYWFRFNYNAKMAVFWYRLAFLGAVGSYGVVVHKMFFRVRSSYQYTRLTYREGLEKLNDKKVYSTDSILMKMQNTLVIITSFQGITTN
jgi:hypothetical protein